ncbi:MAG: restriction endonuclease subunit S [Lachnospiraceae bacterium]|nr:restriction endonuclease subunit S [Lachnospiraceae bacterium]
MVDNLARKLDDAPKVEIEISEAPVKWCSVSLAEMVERGKRLEASVFDVEARQAFDIIHHSVFDTKPLIGDDGFVSNAHYGNRLKRRYVSKCDNNAIGFIGSSEMLDVYPHPVKYMIDDDNNKCLKVKRNTVLISRSGTIGNVTFVSKTLEKLLVSEHAIRLECVESPGYVYCYLKSRVGQKLIQSKVYGAVVSQIEPEHLADIPVPNAPNEIKSKINDLIMQSYDLRDESNALIDQAQALLVKELNLPPISEIKVDTLDESKSVQTFNIKLSEMAGRADASYHVPIVDAIVDILKKNAAEVTTVGDKRISSDIILPGRFKRVYVEEGYGRVFIGGKQLYELDPTNKKYLSLVHHGERIAKQLELHEKMTLITCSGTIGKVTLVGKQWENWTANQHIIRVVPANNDVAGYISTFLSSDYGYELIKHFTYGAVVDEIDDNHVRQIQIPILKNQDIQKQINDLALQANEKRYKAFLLEQKALKILDDDIIYAK